MNLNNILIIYFFNLIDISWLIFVINNIWAKIQQILLSIESHLFLFVLVFPLCCVIFFFFLSFLKNTFQKKIYNYALLFSTILFLSSLGLILSSKRFYMFFQSPTSMPLSPLIDHNWFIFGFDYISLSLIILTNLFIFLCILSIQFIEIRGKYTPTELITKLFFIQWGLNCAFSSLDLLAFFIFFEATLIPIFMIILQGGSRERRARASYLIAIYTLFGSIFMLFNILYFLAKIGTTNYLIIYATPISSFDQKWLWITFFLAFAVKVPVFPFHIWLPEAHVEAPTIGSVILAALLLKLGIYGLIRFNVPLFPQGQEYFKHFIVILTICSFFYTNLTAIRQVDIKKIIAYSSVVHMNLIVLGLLCVSVESLDGAIYQMLAHGIVSGALFFCIGIIYERFKSRFLWYYGGIAFVLPLFSIFFFIFILANISFPLTSNFIGEMLLFAGIFKDNFTIGVFSALSMFWGVIYNIWTYNRICFGNLKFYYTKDNLAPHLHEQNNTVISSLADLQLKPINWQLRQNLFKNTFLNKSSLSTPILSKHSTDINHNDFYILMILTICLIITGIYSSIILDYIAPNTTQICVHYYLNLYAY
jgi:proton-translocating NADH-quinone oxidoreductase chain M